ncbi:protein shisa-5-like [Haliotis rufescens]|uniref:protein shisa-5-like n=1 Tax=Haliotis rufescens TaxID=6454 RepID=UPI00201F54F4|nr:protein shisa-5-like [Haliotis rufescens]
MTSLKIVLIILPLLAISSAYQVCYEKTSFGSYRAKYCSISCCGNSLYRYCCGSSYGSSGSATGLIIGIVCGVGSLIALIVGIVLCCVCCCRSSQGRRGQVVTTNQLAVITTANTTNAAFAPNYGYPAQPPAGVFYPPQPGMAGPPPAYTPAAAATAPAYVPPQGYPPAAAAAAMTPPNAATSPKHTDEEHMYTALER